MSNKEIRIAKLVKTKAPIEIVKPTSSVEIEPKISDVSVIEKKKILFVASEAAPFIATGGLAEVIGSLPKALATDPNYDIRVVLPMYSGIKTECRRMFSFLGNIYVPLGWRNQYCGIFKYEYESSLYHRD